MLSPADNPKSPRGAVTVAVSGPCASTPATSVTSAWRASSAGVGSAPPARRSVAPAGADLEPESRDCDFIKPQFAGAGAAGFAVTSSRADWGGAAANVCASFGSGAGAAGAGAALRLTSRSSTAPPSARPAVSSLLSCPCGWSAPSAVRDSFASFSRESSTAGGACASGAGAFSGAADCGACAVRSSSFIARVSATRAGVTGRRSTTHTTATSRTASAGAP